MKHIIIIAIIIVLTVIIPNAIVTITWTSNIGSILPLMSEAIGIFCICGQIPIDKITVNH